MTEVTEERLKALAQLLLDFGRAPGRYAIRLGEPRVLHERLDTVAQWASGRIPDEVLASQEASAASLVAAAVLFVQRVCFEPGNNHYQVLGFTRETFAPDLLRQRYRTLIRLTHPDVAVKGLPSNAAWLVNRAYEVLGDSQLRRGYDEQLSSGTAAYAAPRWQGTATGAPSPEPGLMPAHSGAIAVTHGWGERWAEVMARYPRQLRLGLATAAVASLVVLLLLWSASDSTRSGALVVARSPGLQAAAPVERKPTPSQAAAPSAKEAATLVATQQPQASLVADSAREARAPASTSLALPMPSLADPQVRGNPVALPAPAGTAVVGASPSAPATPRATGAVPTPGTPPAALATVVQPYTRVDAALPVIPGAPTTVVAAASPTPVSSATRAGIPATMTTQPLATAVAPATPAKREEPPQPAAEAGAALPAWNVDAAAARRYLEDIVMTFNDSASTKRLNQYLVGMRVKGSLLHPVLELQARLPSVRAQRTAWVESLQPGVLRLQALVVLQPAGDGEAHAYQLEAEFRGTREGTVLDHLHLQPERGT